MIVAAALRSRGRRKHRAIRDLSLLSLLDSWRQEEAFPLDKQPRIYRFSPSRGAEEEEEPVGPSLSIFLVQHFVCVSLLRIKKRLRTTTKLNISFLMKKLFSVQLYLKDFELLQRDEK